MKNKLFNQYKNNKDVRILTANFASLTFLQVFGYVFPLLTYPYLARVIGSEGFGYIALASSIICYFQTVVDFGFNFTATRDIAKNQQNLVKVSQIFSNVLWCRLFLLLCSFLLFVVMICIIPILRDLWQILLFSFLLIPGHILCPEWFFQAMEKMKYITMLNFVSKTFFTLLIFVFVKEKSDYVYQPLLLSLGYIASGILAMYIILCKWGIKIHQPSWISIKKTLKESFDVFLNQIFPTLYNAFSVLLLGVFCGPVANGLFDAGTKLVDISQQFLKIISRTFFPFLSRKIDKHTLFSKIYMLFTLIVTLGLIFFAPFLIPVFFSEEFSESIKVLRLMAISGVFLMMSNIYGTNYLIIIGRERSLRNLTMYASLLGFVIAIPLIYYGGYMGAVAIIVFVRMLLGVGSYLLAYNCKKNICKKNLL